jgi:hypothetical protein
MDNKPRIAKPMLYGIMVGMLLFGTGVTVTEKIEDETVTNDCNYFTHPFLQNYYSSSESSSASDFSGLSALFTGMKTKSKRSWRASADKRILKSNAKS